MEFKIGDRVILIQTNPGMDDPKTTPYIGKECTIYKDQGIDNLFRWHIEFDDGHWYPTNSDCLTSMKEKKESNNIKHKKSNKDLLGL